MQCILGPILFLVYINDLSNFYNFQTTLNADDSILKLSYKNEIVREQVEL